MKFSNIGDWDSNDYQLLAFLEWSCPFRKDELMPASNAHNPRCGITFRIFAVGVIEGREAAACAHLQIKCLVGAGWYRGYKTNLILIGEPPEVLIVWVPRNKVCVPRPKLWVFLITWDLPSLESETSIDAKGLIIEIPVTNVMSGKGERQFRQVYILGILANRLPIGW
jgi:hypothetical protein